MVSYRCFGADGTEVSEGKKQPGRSARIMPNAKRSPRETRLSERGAHVLDLRFQADPRHDIAQQRHFHQADRFADREAIRRNHMESPLPRITVIGTFVHNRVMSEDVNMGKASGIGDPICTLEISRSHPNVEYWSRGFSRSCPRLPSCGL